MSKIQDFVNAYNAGAQVKLDGYIERQNKYKTARATAIAITDLKTCSWPYEKTPGSDNVYQSNPTVKTVGDLFKYIYPNENGGVQWSIDISSLGDVREAFKDSESMPLYDILKSNYGASNDVDDLNDLKPFVAV